MENLKELSDGEIAAILSDKETNLLEIERQAKNLREDIFQINKERFIRKYKMDIGTRVSLNGKEALVDRFINKWNGLTPIIIFFKKDGTPGTREQKLYSWDFKNIKIL